ncbi:MAG: right-handed parallel beta-helix repeat-containing protein [Candidatus Enteromonas sp.]|nr:right-handed parallel beta-helix repeat-containing protein [Candidatus Enteromonas sp.]
MKHGSLFLSLFLLFSLASCEGGNSSTDESISDSVAESQEVTPPVDPTFLGVELAPKYPEIAASISYTSYYFDAEKGNDGNDGLTPENPKKTLGAASSIAKTVTADVPTKLLFKAGSTFQGKLTLERYKASAESPLIVSSYGVSEEFPYAVIKGNDNDTAVEVKASNIRVSGLEITAPLGYRGIHVTTASRGAMENIVIHDNYLHDLNFNLGDAVLPTDLEELDGQTVQSICPDSRFSYNCGGIIFEANTPIAKGPSWYENVWISNNKVERVTRTGIWVFSNWAQRPGIDWGNNPYYSDEIGWYPHKNVNIVGNQILYSGGDGIILGATVGGYIESNTSLHAQVLGRPNYYCAAIWCHSCKDLVFQFNESAYTHTARDGQGFDIDIGNSNILFQYNYAHHNDGGGLLCCNTKTNLIQYTEDGEMVFDEDGLPVVVKTMAPWHDVTIKNNVFSDNDNGNLILSGTVDDVDFSNNTVVMGGDFVNQKIMDTKDFYTGIPGDRWSFRNNIFAMRKKNTIRFEMAFSKTFEYENNVYFNFDETIPGIMKGFGEDHYVDADPQFVKNEAGIGFENVFHFIPQNPAMFEGGSTLPVMLLYDLNGNDVSDLRYYGAFGTTSQGDFQ